MTEEVLREVSEDEKLRWERFTRQVHMLGQREGLRNANETGQKEATERIAKNLIAMGMAFEEISEVTGLPVWEIEKLKDE